MRISRDITAARIFYMWRCSECLATAEAWQTINAGETIAEPTLPEKWRRLDDKFICPDHEVTVSGVRLKA